MAKREVIPSRLTKIKIKSKLQGVRKGFQLEIFFDTLYIMFLRK